MHKRLLFFCLLFSVGLTVNLMAQQESGANYQLNGRLQDSENGASIPFVHITNLDKGLRTVSDSSGLFSLPAREGDSLLISSVSYGQKVIAAPAKPQEGSRVLIQLAPNVYQLEEVVVHRFPSEKKFKDQLLSMDVPEENEPDLRLPEGLSFAPPAEGSGQPTMRISGGISGIAAKFSKKERGRIFAAEMKAKDERKAIIHTKYNREIVKHITGIEDDEQVDEFMQSCALSENFLYGASEYEIHEAVLACYHDFKQEREG